MILIELDRPRHLRFDMNALCDADQKLDHQLLTILSSSPVMLDTARVLLWAGLKHEDPSLTIERAGELMEIYIRREKSIVPLVKALIDGIQESGLFEAVNNEDREGGQKNLGKSSRNTKR